MEFRKSAYQTCIPVNFKAAFFFEYSLEEEFQNELVNCVMRSVSHPLNSPFKKEFINIADLRIHCKKEKKKV